VHNSLDSLCAVLEGKAQHSTLGIRLTVTEAGLYGLVLGRSGIPQLTLYLVLLAGFGGRKLFSGENRVGRGSGEVRLS